MTDLGVELVGEKAKRAVHLLVNFGLLLLGGGCGILLAIAIARKSPAKSVAYSSDTAPALHQPRRIVSGCICFSPSTPLIHVVINLGSLPGSCD
jgi:hypothetical protein